jgi:2-aminoadipate transaminase
VSARLTITTGDPVTDLGARSVVQFEHRHGIIDLSWGHPDPALLPVAGIRKAAAGALDRYGPDALAYGASAGPAPLLAQIADRLEVVDGRRPDGDELLVTAGNSHGIDLVSTALLHSGDVVLVESPTYHLALRVFRDHGLEVRPVACDDVGLRLDTLADVVRSERDRGRTPRLLYIIPTFHNPTGRLMSAERRGDLIEAARALDLRILEDDVYRELSYGEKPPGSLWSMDDQATVVRLGSFAKSLAPGLRVGFLTADPATVRQISNSGVLESGGGIAHFAALIVADFMSTGEYAKHIENLRRAYRSRRDALVHACQEVMPAGASWSIPTGGYFLWVTLPGNVDPEALRAAAEREGMSFMTGVPFQVDGQGEQAIRLAFSRYSEADLREAMARFARASI